MPLEIEPEELLREGNLPLDSVECRDFFTGLIDILEQGMGVNLSELKISCQLHTVHKVSTEIH